MIGQKQATLTSPPMQAAPEIPFRKEGVRLKGTIVLQFIKIGLVAHLKLQLIQIARLCVTEPDQDLHLMAIEEAIGVISLQGPPKAIQLEKMPGGFQGLNR